jgi:hypothetical protein
MVQNESIKSLALRVLRETTVLKVGKTVCPTPIPHLGQLARQNASTPDEMTTVRRDVAGPGLRERMEESVSQFGQSHARLFPVIGKRVWTSQGTGKLLLVFARHCEILPDGASRTIRAPPEDVIVLQ